MWTCAKCGEEVEDSFEVCWNCGAAKDGGVPADEDEFERDKETLVALETAWAQMRIDYRKTVSFDGDASKALAAARSIFLPLDFIVVRETETSMQLTGPGRSVRMFGDDRFGRISRLRICVGGGELSMEAELEGPRKDAAFFRVLGVFLFIAGFANIGRKRDTGTILAGTIILIAAGAFLFVIGGAMRQANASRKLDEVLDNMAAEAQRQNKN